MCQFLEFEKSVTELENKINELKQVSRRSDDMSFGDLNLDEEIYRLSEKVDKKLYDLYNNLTPLQKVQVARHTQRPHAIDYVNSLTDGFMSLAGDRTFADDPAMIGGIAWFRDIAVVIIGTERGHDTETRLQHNFGMAKPEGYRKAQRLMKLAERFSLPVLTFVDTAGAWPGIEAEARGQAQAIAASTDISLSLKVPIIATIIGEGGSGGAIAIAAADRVLMLEHAIYSVISPEAAASILWKDPKFSSAAAESLKLTAQDLKSLNLIDKIITEPLGGAQRFPQDVIKSVGNSIYSELKMLVDLSPEQLIAERRERFMQMTRLT